MGLEHLSFDPSEVDDSQTVGSYVLAGDDGAQISSQSIAASNWLQTAAATHAGDGTAISATGTSLDVNVTSAIAVDIDHTEDSVQLGDGTNLLTSTTIGSDIGLDVNVINDPTTANDIAHGASPQTDAEAAVGAATAGRTTIFVQNLGANAVYIGKTGVSVANGFRLSKNSVLEAKIGAAVSLVGICDTSKTTDLRYLELVKS